MPTRNRYPSLSGKVAVVTGASKGIGRAICEALLAAGVTVFGASRSDPELSGLNWVQLDMLDAEAGNQLVQCAVRQAGGVDIVVNNVGGLAESHDPTARWGHTLGASADIPDEVWRRTLELNLFAPVRVVRAATPSLIERRGCIINISSVGGVLPDPGIVDYAASKAALNVYTKAISTELGAYGIRANTVSLGAFTTPGWTDPGALGDRLAAKAGLSSGAAKGAMIDAIGDNGTSLGRWGDPSELAAVVLFLASDDASYLTGADIRVDGGLIKTVQH